MKLQELKSDFHELIDKINDPELLLKFYDAINSSVEPGNSSWHLLSDQRQKEILDAYEESEDEANLISLDDIKSKYDKWPWK